MWQKFPYPIYLQWEVYDWAGKKEGGAKSGRDRDRDTGKNEREKGEPKVEADVFQRAAGSIVEPLCPLFNVRHSYLFSPPDRKENAGTLRGMKSLASDLTYFFFCLKKAVPK